MEGDFTADSGNTAWLDAYDHASRHNRITESHARARVYEEMLNQMHAEGTLDKTLVTTAMADLNRETSLLGERCIVSGVVTKLMAYMENGREVAVEDAEPELRFEARHVPVTDMVITSEGYVTTEGSEERPHRIVHLGQSDATEQTTKFKFLGLQKQHYYYIPIDDTIDIRPAAAPTEPNIDLLLTYLPELMQETEARVRAVDISGADAYTQVVRALASIDIKQYPTLGLDTQICSEYLKYLNEILAFNPSSLYKITGTDAVMMRSKTSGEYTSAQIMPGTELYGTITSTCAFPYDPRTAADDQPAAIPQGICLNLIAPATGGKRREVVIPCTPDITISRCVQFPEEE